MGPAVGSCYGVPDLGDDGCENLVMYCKNWMMR
jgi:hypothetical protein